MCNRLIENLKLIVVILMMFLWMSISGGIVLSLDTFFQPPDELSGVLYFLSIGVAASATLNYYR